MATIKLTDIGVNQRTNKTLEQGYIYKDLFLDLQTAYSYNNQLNRKESIHDIQALYNVNAVTNSVINCFITSPGQKILNPTFGIDLRRYIFEAITDNTAFFIRQDIERNLPIMEPRIEVLNVSVIADPDNNQYMTQLQINVPTLNVFGLSIKGNLNTTGYYVS